MIKQIRARLASAHRDTLFFLAIVAFAGFGEAGMNAIFNNFINARFDMSGFARSALELPRELPGLSVAFVTALLFFLSGRRLAAFALALQAAGLILIGFYSKTYAIMLGWLFIYSLGQHLFMPLTSSIGMELAKEGHEGRRLGQFNSVKNLAIVTGSFVIFAGWRWLGFDYGISFAIGAVSLALAFTLMLMMQRGHLAPPRQSFRERMKLHREYRLFYWLNILFGSRKQIFITFAPWVLVTVFHQPTQLVAKLLLIGGIAGIVFQPLLGKAVDHLGERFILCAEALILIVVCAGYGFSRSFLNEQAAFYLTCVCFITDMLLMSVGMARATYLKKIALHPSHVASTLTMAVSIDHIFSISLALISGLVWSAFGYRYVFLIGAFIALVNFFSALRIRIPASKTARA